MTIEVLAKVFWMIGVPALLALPVATYWIERWRGVPDYEATQHAANAFVGGCIGLGTGTIVAGYSQFIVGF